MHLVIIGGGAAGFFGAVTAAENNPGVKVTVLERGKDFLQKVKVSGGGRCNVTHHCFEPRELIRSYPRGSKELAGPFTRFGPEQTVSWFAGRGVELKTEPDGRMFPVTDNSQTIIDCLLQSARHAGVKMLTGVRVEGLKPAKGDRWEIETGNRETIIADKILLTTGSSESVWEILRQLGHTIVAPAPSLFTFNTKDTRLRDLSGISVPDASLEVPSLKLSARGPILITHWGLSGPAVLRLSAWGARAMKDVNYDFALKINWLGDKRLEEILQILTVSKSELSKKQISANALFGVPARLWAALCVAAGVPESMRWADAGKKLMESLSQQLGAATFNIKGKSTFKEEFVTAGGVSLKEVNFKTFESKLFPGLYFAGEVLDIDAITGGFNFQAAWTGGWIAGNSI